MTNKQLVPCYHNLRCSYPRKLLPGAQPVILSLALHIAVALHGDEALVRSLLQARPESVPVAFGDKGLQPVHVAAFDAAAVEVADALLEAWPSSAWDKLCDQSERLPLHMAVEHGAPLAMVEALLAAPQRLHTSKQG